MGSIISTAVAVMVNAGDLAPAARDLQGEALAQWATLYGVDSVDLAYVLGVAYARATVAPDDWDDNPLSGEYADDPTADDVRMVVQHIMGEDDGADDPADAFENGYHDERGDMWVDARDMTSVLDAIRAPREA